MASRAQLPPLRSLVARQRAFSAPASIWLVWPLCLGTLPWPLCLWSRRRPSSLGCKRPRHNGTLAALNHQEPLRAAIRGAVVEQMAPLHGEETAPRAYPLAPHAATYHLSSEQLRFWDENGYLGLLKRPWL